MELIHANPFVRFADRLRFSFQRGPSKTYDCRLLYCLDGKVAVEIGGESYTMRHGSLIIFQPGIEYTICPEKAPELIVFDFDFTQDYSNVATSMIPCPANTFVPEQAHPRISFSDTELFDEPVFFDNVTFIEPMLREIVSEFQEKRLYYTGKTSTLLKSVLFELARYNKLDSKSNMLVTQIMQYIDANISGQITNGDLGVYFNYNPNYLNRLMLRHTGKTLHKYVLQQRIALSLKLIQTTNMTIAEIAMHLGFNSPSHFSYCFKKEMGFSPMQFRSE
ncbi:MAG: helix-turn-helix domain-containing protein [Oscillospiraceae bacterium]|nr:helix-turn-helix domain-containing protein [Oscillospiraceae bacterium]